MLIYQPKRRRKQLKALAAEISHLEPRALLSGYGFGDDGDPGSGSWTGGDGGSGSSGDDGSGGSGDDGGGGSGTGGGHSSCSAGQATGSVDVSLGYEEAGSGLSFFGNNANSDSNLALFESEIPFLVTIDSAESGTVRVTMPDGSVEEQWHNGGIEKYLFSSSTANGDSQTVQAKLIHGCLGTIIAEGSKTETVSYYDFIFAEAV